MSLVSDKEFDFLLELFELLLGSAHGELVELRSFPYFEAPAVSLPYDGALWFVSLPGEEFVNRFIFLCHVGGTVSG